MSKFTMLFAEYVNALPPFLAFLTIGAIIGWKFWLKNNIDVTSDKALISVSSSYKNLSDGQQQRITQQDTQITRLEKLVQELQSQLGIALEEITRLRILMESLRINAAKRDLKLLDDLSDNGHTIQIL